MTKVNPVRITSPFPRCFIPSVSRSLPCRHPPECGHFVGACPGVSSTQVSAFPSHWLWTPSVRPEGPLARAAGAVRALGLGPAPSCVRAGGGWTLSEPSGPQPLPFRSVFHPRRQHTAEGRGPGTAGGCPHRPEPRTSLLASEATPTPGGRVPLGLLRSGFGVSAPTGKPWVSGPGPCAPGGEGHTAPFGPSYPLFTLGP